MAVDGALARVGTQHTGYSFVSCQWYSKPADVATGAGARSRDGSPRRGLNGDMGGSSRYVLAVESLLKHLIDESRTHGWAIGNLRTTVPGPALGTRAWMLTYEAKQLNLTPVPNRHGEAAHSTLRPTTVMDAHPSSLSATVGMGVQPLHTDGAHLARVPDYVVLWCADTNSTPTRFWAPWNVVSRNDEHGMFVVRSGSRTWLAPAIEPYRNLRFDPICMHPGDAAARRLAVLLQEPPDHEVQSVTWDVPGKVLLLRNRFLLHGRAAVAANDTDRRIERIALATSVK